MRKILTMLLAIIVCLSMVACGQTSSKPETPETVATEPTTPPPTEPPKEIHWTEEFYVDDFGDPTSDSYIRGIFDGSFSNSATAGSELTVCFFMPKKMDSASYDMFTVRMLEYGSNRVSFIGCDEWDVTVKVKIDGVVTEDEVDYLLPDTGEFAIQRGNKVFRAVLDALDSDKKISFVVTVGGYGTETYRFDIDANGLEDIDHSWKGYM